MTEFYLKELSEKEWVLVCHIDKSDETHKRPIYTQCIAFDKGDIKKMIKVLKDADNR